MEFIHAGQLVIKYKYVHKYLKNSIWYLEVLWMSKPNDSGQHSTPKPLYHY